MKKIVLEKKLKKILSFFIPFIIFIGLIFYFTGYYKYILDILYPTQKVVYETYKITKSTFQVLVDIKSIITENQQLKKQVEELKLIEDRYKTLKFENFKLRSLLNFSKKYKNHKIIGAEVIGYPPDFFVKAVFVDVGKNQGVKIGDYVISNGFLVGKVVEVGNFSSKILLTNDSNFKIPARTRKTRELVFYNGKGLLDFVKPSQDIRVGDIIETTGIEGYPKGIPIGKIVSVEYKEGVFFKKVKVKPFVNQFAIEYLLIIGRKTTH